MIAVGASPDAGWQPSEEYLRRSRLLRFMQHHGIASYADLYRRSVDDIVWFWDAVVRDELDLVWERPYDRVLDLGDGPARPHWFVGGRLNYVTSAVDRHSRGEYADHVAIIWEGEEGATRRLTYADLHAEVTRLAAGLRRLGIRRGDRVGIFMPMLPETVVAALACSRIGAVFVPAFSGYGPEALAARLRNAGARLLITADGSYRRGRTVDMKETADSAVSLAPDVERVIVVRRTGDRVMWRTGRDLHWEETLDLHGDPSSEAMGPEDPFMIIYTSGTSGQPKGAVHTHAGFPVKAAQDFAHCFDVHSDDTLFWVTDMGWVMGPLVTIATLILGGTIFLYDGAPDYPDPERIWKLVERHHVSILGLSPTVIRGLMQHGDEQVRRHDLTSLRVLGSTGEPWGERAWQWYFREVGGGRCPIVNYSGGTEVTGGILACTTLQPIRPCSFNTASPGMAADVVDEQGRSVRGQVGELVVRQPWVGMTRGFWEDDDRYLDTYWSRFPGMWTHGDWAIATDDGYWYIRGRSDDTLKVAGKRVGPAEVESAAMGHPAVKEAAAVGVPHAVKGEVIAIFVVLRAGAEASDVLREEIRRIVAGNLGRALRPDEVLFVGDLPRTRNGKIMRRIIRDSYLGTEPGDLSSLDNPDSMAAIGEAV
jgi:acetyl-CoA synthetase